MYLADFGSFLAITWQLWLDLADYSVIFAETTEVLAGALDLLSEEAKPLGLRVSWIKTKVEAFDDILDPTVQSIPVNDENVELTKSLTYLGSVIHSSTSCELKVIRRLGRVWSAMNSLDEGVWRCRYICRRTKVRVFRSMVLPVLLYSCESQTLTVELRRRLNSCRFAESLVTDGMT